jgi:hypothetical protein
METATVPRAAIAAAMCAALLFSAQQSAHADYLGLGCRLHTTVTINGTARSVWRVYAIFDNPDDYFGSMAGSELLHPLIIQSMTSNGQLGSPFVNPVGGANKAPTADAIAANPDAQWDTFCTVGVPVSDEEDNTILSPGFTAEFGGQFITGNSTSAIAAWLTPGPKEQARAGGPNAVNGDFFNAGSTINGMGVLAAQLTVNAGEGVRGTVIVGVSLDNGLAGGFSIPNQTFDAIPAPATIGLFALVAAFAPRRRRN